MPQGARITLVAAAVAAVLSSSAFGQLRMVSYNVAAVNGDLAALSGVLSALRDDDQPGFSVAPHVYVFQETQSDDVDTLHVLLDQTAPPGVTYAVATYTNDNEDGAAGAQALFYRTDTLVELAGDHADLYTGAGRFADRWRLRLLGYDSVDASFYVYSAHLKASQGATNETLRLEGVLTIRDDAASLPAQSHVLYAGDFNFYGNDEPGYDAFLAGGAGQAIDPYGSGTWSGSGHSIKHTQSPRLVSNDDLVGGGLDDRFDFVLLTGPFDDGAGLSYLEHSLRSLGNDGNHYNGAINDGNNLYYPGDITRSNALADDLHEASDHLPIITEFQIPGFVAVDLPADFGRVIQFADHTVEMTLWNAANTLIPDGADDVVYTATASGALVGVEGGVVAPLADAVAIAFDLQTNLVGARTGQIIVDSTSQGAGVPGPVLTSGTIVRRSVPSFDASSVVEAINVDWSVTPDTGIAAQTFDVFNDGFDVLQARLDIDGVTGLAAPFAVGRPLPAGIGSTPGSIEITFDTDGAASGVYHVDLVVATSDEDLPGETNGLLVLSIDVTVDGKPGLIGDIDGDGDVDFTDLLALLSAWGVCPPGPCPADLDASGTVDFLDLLSLLSNWT